jgi:anti-sigma B factor antagonist
LAAGTARGDAAVKRTLNLPVLGDRRNLRSTGFTVKFSGTSSWAALVNFSINVRQAEGVSLVEVTGRLTSFEAKAFREMIHGLLKQGQTNMVLNLTGLEYLDSSGVGELVRNYMSVVKNGGAMKVVGLAPKVEEILKVTQLYQVFPEFPDEASALESFTGPGTT